MPARGAGGGATGESENSLARRCKADAFAGSEA